MDEETKKIFKDYVATKKKKHGDDWKEKTAREIITPKHTKAIHNVMQLSKEQTDDR